MKKFLSIIGLIAVIGNTAFSAGLDFDPGDEKPSGFPLITKSLKPQIFDQDILPPFLVEKTEKELPVDICIISNDELSKKWLKDPATKRILSNMHSDGYCLAVNLNSLDDLHEIKATFKKLGLTIPVIPMFADWFFHKYSIDSYPGVLTPTSGSYMQRFNP